MRRLLALAAFFLAATVPLGAAAQASLSAAPASVYTNHPVSATWSGIASPTSLDWIALYAAGAPDNAYIAFRYTGGAASGSIMIDVPLNAAAGTYELRLFSNNVYTLLATSNSFTVQVPPAASLSESPASVTAGQGASPEVTATWSSIFEPTSLDWIALYPVGALDNAFIAYRYTDGTASGSTPLAVPANAAAGSYELRLFSNNVYIKLATSNSFTVENPPPATLGASPGNVNAGDPATATWSAIFSPTALDWIALYPAGAPNNAFIAWRYTDATAAGSAPLTVPMGTAAGTYELRLFKNNVYTLLATSNTFTVGALPPALHFIEVDHLGTPREIYNDQQQLVWRWSNQEPFADSPPDENPTGLGTFFFDLGFPGQVRNRETGTWYNYFRDCYESATGRYCQADPVGLRGGLNTYAYVESSPLSFVDPNGLQIAPGAGLSGSSSLGTGSALSGRGLIPGKQTADDPLGGLGEYMQPGLTPTQPIVAASVNPDEIIAGAPVPPFPGIKNLSADCKPGNRIVFVIPRGGHKGRTNIEQEYQCTCGLVTWHLIVTPNGKIVHNHFRTGGAKGSADD